MMDSNCKTVYLGLVLEEKCKDCNGAGVIHHPSWRQWWLTHRELPPEDHWLRKEPEEMECLACNGTGYAPTDLGHRVLEFLGRHLKR